MKRISTGLGLAALAGIAATVGLTAPAHASATPATTASANGYVLYGYYNWGDECTSLGYDGEQTGKWVAYFCDTISPSSPDGPGDYALYVEY